MRKPSEYGFSEIAKYYDGSSVVQKSAADILLDLLKIGDEDDVLDIGCGTGYLTRKIRAITKGKVVGIDPSRSMIDEARRRSKGLNIEYKVKSAEEIIYREEFDLIVCNSVLQWLKDPELAISNFWRALRKGGKIGVQAPAKKIYCPNFIKAVEKVKEDRRTQHIFAHFKEPWFFLETAEEYKSIFERHGFEVIFSEIREVVSEHTPDEVFSIFKSGAIVGYLNQDFYEGVELTENYVSAFLQIIRKSFEEQADERGVVKLVFRRLFLVGVKR